MPIKNSGDSKEHSVKKLVGGDIIATVYLIYAAVVKL